MLLLFIASPFCASANFNPSQQFVLEILPMEHDKAKMGHMQSYRHWTCIPKVPRPSTIYPSPSRQTFGSPDELEGSPVASMGPPFQAKAKKTIIDQKKIYYGEDTRTTVSSSKCFSPSVFSKEKYTDVLCLIGYASQCAQCDDLGKTISTSLTATELTK